MFQDESNVRRPIEIWNHLHVMAQAIIGQLLIFSWRESLRFHQSGSTAKLEVPFQLEEKAVDLVEGALPNRPLEFLHAVEMVRIVPVDLPLPQIRPVHDFAFRQPRFTDVGTEQLDQRFDTVEQSSARVSSNRYAIRRELDPVSLLGEGGFVAIDCGSDGNGFRGNREPQNRPSPPHTLERIMTSFRKTVLQFGNR